MREVVAIGVVIGLALLGLLPQLRRLRTAIGFEHFITTGHLYLVVGVVLGPVGLGLISAEFLRALAPVLIFLLAWMGLIVGLRMEFGLLKRVGRVHWEVTALSSLLPAAGVPAVLWALPATTGRPDVLLVAAACAAGTAATAATYLLRSQHANELTLVRVSASLDDWAIVLLAAAGFVAGRGFTLEAGVVGGAGVVAALVVGGSVVLLAPRLHQAGEELVTVIGSAALVGGVAAYLGLSTVVAGAIAGLVIANLGHRRRGIRDVYELVTRVERPFYLGFVVLAGAIPSFASPGLWIPLTLAFVGVRGLAKLVAGRLSARRAPDLVHPTRVSVAFLPMSPLALAVAVDLWLVHPGPLTEALVVAVALGWVLFESLAAVVVPAAMGRVGRGAGAA